MDVRNEIIYNADLLKPKSSWLQRCLYLVRCNITIIGHDVTWGAFKNCGTFTECITKIDGTTADDAEDLDLVISMYNLLEYSSNYSDTAGCLWFHSKEESNTFNAGIEYINNYNSFEYNA